MKTLTLGHDKMRLAITGATGYIARGVLAEVPDDALQLRALSRRPRPSWAPPATEWITVPSYIDRPALAAALTDSDYILHLADNPTRLAARNPEDSLHNADAVIAAAGDAGIEGIILASSIYAREARTGYGAAKRALEDRFLNAEDIKTIILRLPPVYGPGCSGGFAALAGLVRKHVPLPLGAARAPRAYLSRTNLASLVRSIAGAGPERWAAAAGRIFEPSDGQAVSTRDLAVMMGAQHGRRPLLLPVPPVLLQALGYATGRREIVAGIVDRLEMPPVNHLTTAFGWRPVEQMPQSLAFLSDHLNSA